ncbi:MAG: hypothetical protein OEV94_10700 [Deltaproteobacteria bacterium]|nr:hypothetical protein [Deltaproteobacteria bacterium]
MANKSNPSGGQPPLGQRLFDSPFLLLAAGLVIMLVFYTAWGIIELVTMPQALLP